MKPTETRVRGGKKDEGFAPNIKSKKSDCFLDVVLTIKQHIMSHIVLRKWIHEGEGILKLNWEIQPFYFTSTITWRGLTIGIKVKINKTDSGHHKQLIFQFNGRTITHDTWKWKNWGNENMDFVPFIKVDHHALKISVTAKSLQLTDPSRNEIRSPENNSGSLFKVIRFQEYTECDKPNQGDPPPLREICRESITLYKSKFPKPYNVMTAYLANEELYISRYSFKHFVRTEHTLKLSKEELTKLIKTMGFITNSEGMILKNLKDFIEGERFYEIIKHYLDKKEIKYKETTKRLWIE